MQAAQLRDEVLHFKRGVIGRQNSPQGVEVAFGERPPALQDAFDQRQQSTPGGGLLAVLAGEAEQ